MVSIIRMKRAEGEGMEPFSETAKTGIMTAGHATARLRQPVSGRFCFRRGSERPFSRKALEHEMTGTEKQKTILLVEDEAITAMAENRPWRGSATRSSPRPAEKKPSTRKKRPTTDLDPHGHQPGKGHGRHRTAALILRQRGRARGLPVEPHGAGGRGRTGKDHLLRLRGQGFQGITVLDASIKMAFKLFARRIRKTEEALREGEDRMRAIVEGTPSFSSISRTRGQIPPTYPRAIKKITGYEAETWMKGRTGSSPTPRQSARERRTRTCFRGNFKREPVLLEIRPMGTRCCWKPMNIRFFKDGKSSACREWRTILLSASTRRKN